MRISKKKLNEAAKGTKGNANGEADFLYADGVIVPRNTGYKNFNELKKNLPPIKQEIPAPGRGTYHHIIEENPTNLVKYSPEFIHHKRNIVPLDSAKGAVHGKVSGYYSQKSKVLPAPAPGRIRDHISTLPTNEQFNFGK